MAVFRDQNGRQWVVKLDGPTIKTVRAECQIDLVDVGGESYEKLANDPVKLVDVLWVLCRPQAQQAGITDAQFGEALVGDPIEAATAAMLEAITDFLPQKRRSLMLALAAKNQEMREKAMATVLAKVNDPETERILTQAMEDKIATPIIPAALLPSPTPLLFTDPSIPMSERIVYYYFVTAAENPHPEGSVMVLPDVYILAPTWSDSTYGSDTAADLRTALEAVLEDSRNGWISSHVDVVQVTFGDGHADVVLQGEYFGVGDVTLIAARMQILMTLFANNSVQTATVTLNGDTIGNLGVSNSINARPANYVFTRAEIEAFMNEPPDGSP